MSMRISERDMEIVRRWNQGGDTLQSIAIDYDVSRERIRQILKRCKNKGISVMDKAEASSSRSKNFHEELYLRFHNEYIKLYENGHSTKQISDKLGLPSNQLKLIQDICKENGFCSYKERIYAIIKRNRLEKASQFRELRDSIISMRNADYSLQEIADNLNLSKIRVSQHIRDMKVDGIEVPGSRISGPQNDDKFIKALEIESYLENEIHISEIALRMVISQHTVSDLIWEYLIEK
tara:strand:+ start:285 stop:992 length:708 start_codon:yes stop_codon:yes gene_type:complete